VVQFVVFWVESSKPVLLELTAARSKEPDGHDGQKGPTVTIDTSPSG
jgi:hypothetical protein